MSKKKHTFADDYEEPTALAFTDFTKPSPVLEGKDAERFILMIEENERKAIERSKEPMTLEEAESKLSYLKLILSFEEDRIKDYKKNIKKLKDYINSINGKK